MKRIIILFFILSFNKICSQTSDSSGKSPAFHRLAKIAIAPAGAMGGYKVVTKLYEMPVRKIAKNVKSGLLDVVKPSYVKRFAFYAKWAASRLWVRICSLGFVIYTFGEAAWEYLFEAESPELKSNAASQFEAK